MPSVWVSKGAMFQDGSPKQYSCLQPGHYTAFLEYLMEGSEKFAEGLDAVEMAERAKLQHGFQQIRL